MTSQTCMSAIQTNADVAQTVTVLLNGHMHEVAAGTTISALLAELGVEPRRVAVELNLDLVPRAMHAQRRLAPGDRIEIVTLVGGG